VGRFTLGRGWVGFPLTRPSRPGTTGPERSTSPGGRGERPRDGRRGGWGAGTCTPPQRGASRNDTWGEWFRGLTPPAEYVPPLWGCAAGRRPARAELHGHGSRRSGQPRAGAVERPSAGVHRGSSPKPLRQARVMSCRGGSPLALLRPLPARRPPRATVAAPRRTRRWEARRTSPRSLCRTRKRTSAHCGCPGVRRSSDRPGTARGSRGPCRSCPSASR